MNDDELDRRLRDWGTQAGDAARNPYGPAVTHRVDSIDRPSARRSRLVPALAVAAAVATLVAGVRAAQSGGSAGGRTAVYATGSGDVYPSTGVSENRQSSASATNSNRPSTSPVSNGGLQPNPSPGPAPVSAGQQRIVFHGLSIDVPADWPLNARHCVTPIKDTVILPGPVFDCMSTIHPAVTSVEFTDGPLDWLRDTLTDVRTSATSVDGQPATRLAGQDPDASQPYVIALNVPSLPAQVVIRSPQQAIAQALADSLAIADVDPNGCASRHARLGVLPTSQPPARPEADSTVVPGTPTGVTICRYEAGLLEQSTSLDAADRTSLVKLLNSLPTGLSQLMPKSYSPTICRNPASAPGSLTGLTALDSEAYLIHVLYQSGPTLDVVVRLGRCGMLGASNGTRTGQLTMDMQRLMIMAGSTQGMPEHLQPAG